ncbi:flavoprotein [Clostridiaceae bacterium UIB06]|uniref:Flavoprotein n=1 Tax=Clostridium thailandense TaxID=2794346 RepID=A0A949TSZ2_9CLOT|nr:flavoprotein [Clostridium thailandense]MBV7274797.1 flavoprotein [Clostridium thailandense]MCH5137258.1 flavoprotein [Clostridiaceae bacterium UIB06]
MDIEDLLKTIVTQLVAMMNKRVVIFISGGAVNLKGIFDTLASMKMLQYDIVITEAAKKVIPEQYISNLNYKIIDCKVEMTKAIREDEFILVPVMTRNTLAKCATGLQDNLITVGIAEALMMNKEIIAVRDSFDPQNDKNISLGFSKNQAYNKLILGYEDSLTNFGMKFINACELKQAITGKFGIGSNINQSVSIGQTVVKQENNIKEPVEEVKNFNASVSNVTESKKILSGVLTTEDLMTAARNSKEIYIKQGSLITPMAKDYIYNNKLVVKYC